VVGLLLPQLEPRSLVDPAGVLRHVVGPEHDLGVAGAAGEGESLPREVGEYRAVPGEGVARFQARPLIEIDGLNRCSSLYDGRRTAWLWRCGVRVLRLAAL
jgi:hypothetical protein